MSFPELGLSEGVLRAVAEAGYEHPTPIQKQAIPQILMGRDVLGCAQTGTGKTAGFTLPMIDILSQGRAKARMPRSLILEPTRELAAQVEQNFETYGKYSRLTTALLIGGVSFTEQEKKLDRGVDVLIATPGRLLDHFERGKVLMNDVGFLVIDEADRMLDMGFIPDVERIVGLITRSHQTLFFSATMPAEIRRLADRFLRDPKEISVTPPASVAETVEQAMGVIEPRDKRAALRAILRTQVVKNALLFCNRKRDVGVLHRSLTRHGYNAGALHGDLEQWQRMETLDRFKSGDIQLLVCSDVAARGLDIAAVSHVFNFDVPTHPEDYVHRIGRTGRAGRQGHAFTLATPDDGKYIAAIEKLIGTRIPRVEIEEIAAAEFGEETKKSKRRGARRKPAGQKTSEAPSRTRDARRKDQGGKRDSRRRRDRIEDAPDYGDTPFGETDQVPAFLRRSTG
ncbi:MAG: DEAD/DEAH box helicase [Rhodospirillales bacterium]|nr:MAG: DEAD/DEAH box helicase [Rhodospirillales bacterium]